MDPPLVVLDTMVVISAIIGNREGPSAAVLDAVATGDVRLAISDDQLSEVVRVMGYSTIEESIGRPVRAFEVALEIGTMGYMYHPRLLDLTNLRYDNDGWIFDLAYAASVDYIVCSDTAVLDAAAALGFEAKPPEDLLEILRRLHER